MEFAYLDESGDLGGRGSKHLVLTLMCTAQRKELTKIIVEAKQRLLENTKSRKWLNSQNGEIKFYGFPDEVLLTRVLKKIADLEIEIHSMIFAKEGADLTPSHKCFILSYLFMHILEKPSKEIPSAIIADLDFFNKEKSNYFLLGHYDVHGIKVSSEVPDDFNEHMCIVSEATDKSSSDKHCIAFLPISEGEYQRLKGGPNFIIEIRHMDSKRSEELQALDLICGSIFRYYERNDDRWIKILENGKHAKIMHGPLQKKK